MRISILFAFVLLFSNQISAQKPEPSIFVDKHGVMRYSDTKKEASYFGVNYTLPFAHAYRAMNYLGINHKEAIDKDVYHFARLGFNAYRIHIWDVEISDIHGNLLQNQHVDLFDYLLFKLKERNIKIVITAMTQFGNGYPERNIATGAFTYFYPKCGINEDLDAQEAQENYIKQLVNHVNPYTKLSYKNDPDIVAIEINNEPCHKGTPKQTKSYINRMVKALRNTGFKKPVFYNVSHNLSHLEAYYSSDIQGTTFQWYPTGLVAGKTREGNFLPFVDDYNIPFFNMKGFQNKAKLVYEYDPADNLYGYLHPAIVRSFRKSGFQWITQFAYDPIDMARFNTEYQTHYLNLAYTPGKAISMKIAAEAAYTIPMYKNFGKYPKDTIFDDFRVSYLQDLSELNSVDKFYYSNNTVTQPKDTKQLRSIAGVGNSPIISYEGNGAYFLDKLEDGIWRLEIMPDVFLTTDPFKKTSLKSEVAKIGWFHRDMTIRLPDFTGNFLVKGINNGNKYVLNTKDGFINSISPGVYLLEKEGVNSKRNWNGETKWQNIRLNEFVAPQESIDNFLVIHNPISRIETGNNLTIDAVILSKNELDSVVVYSDKISFWRQNNPYFKMEKLGEYIYRAVIPASEISSTFNYNIVVFDSDKSFTFPQNMEGMPLDWDFTDYEYYATELVDDSSSIVLFDAEKEANNLESFIFPKWHFVERKLLSPSPFEKPYLSVKFVSDARAATYFLQKSIKKNIENRIVGLKKVKNIYLKIRKSPDSFHVGFVTNTGFTYMQKVSASDNLVKLPITNLVQHETPLLPLSYPEFMHHYFKPENSIPFRIQDIEKLIISVDGGENQTEIFEISSVWLGE